MKFSTEAVEKLAEIMVKELNEIGRGGEGIREVETQMRELLREVGAKALGNYLEQKMNSSKNKKRFVDVGDR